MKRHDQFDLPQAGTHHAPSRSAVLPALEMDAANYLPDLAAFDLTEAEKVALLQTLWDIMKAFVEMGVDVGQADICGRIFADSDSCENHTTDDVKSSFSKATETTNRKNRKETPT